MTISLVPTVSASMVSTSIVSFFTDVVSPSLLLFSTSATFISDSKTSDTALPSFSSKSTASSLASVPSVASASLIMEFICLNISQPIMTQVVIIKASFR